MWILDSKIKDLLLIIFPGLITYLAFILLNVSNFSTGSSLLALMVLIIIDTGHVYTTAWRTYFNKEEVLRTPLYKYVPIVIFGLFFTWHFAKIPYIWNFVFYATIFHYIRQSYGILKWYEKLNNSFHHFTGKVIYLSSIIPFAAMHFSENFNPQYYSDGDFFLYPSPHLFNLCVLLQALLFVYWIYNEFKIKKIELNRILFILGNALMYSTAFLGLLKPQLLLASFVMAHGLPYIYLMVVSLKKTQPRFNWSFTRLSTFMLVFALIFGAGEYFFEDLLLQVDNLYIENRDWAMSTLIALYLIPLFAHFTFDAIIWKKKHPDSRKIFN
jgi:hypothetical protein